jgi:hypothetical protein
MCAFVVAAAVLFSSLAPSSLPCVSLVAAAFAAVLFSSLAPSSFLCALVVATAFAVDLGVLALAVRAVFAIAVVSLLCLLYIRCILFLHRNRALTT